MSGTRKSFLLTFFIIFLTCGVTQSAENAVLVYTRNYVSSGTGYVHDNIALSVAAVKKIGAEQGFAVEVSNDPAVFTDGNLKRFRALVFANSNNEAFSNDEQRAAFQKFMRAGGGLVGIHSASASERHWPYFWAVMGGKFVRHPKMQKFVVKNLDRNHPATKNLPAEFEWTDECYYHESLSPHMKVLLSTDPAAIEDADKVKSPPGLVAGAIPLAWYQEHDGGREFYAALGHNKQDYANPLLYEQIKGGILWAMGLSPR